MATTGQSLLDLLAGGKAMRAQEITAHLGVSVVSVYWAARYLVRRGYIIKSEEGYQITNNGRFFLASGKRRSSGSQKGDFAARSRLSLRGRVWNLIRIRTMWSIDDLLMTLADGTEKDAERGLWRYVRALLEAGYVERTPRNPQLFRLINNTGRQAPALNTRSKTLTDPNTGEVHDV